jgi:hypothetical protein
VPVFGVCIEGPNGGPNSTAADSTTIFADAAHQLCFDLRFTPSGGTNNLYICDQRIPAPCPASPQCSSIETGFLARANIAYKDDPGGHEGQMFSFAFSDDWTKKYYQIFAGSTLTPAKSGYVFPRDTLF